jgi:hypothetical protein
MIYIIGRVIEMVKEYSLMYGHLGNGLTVWNKLERDSGDYVKVAHIDRSRKVTFIDKDLPVELREQIIHEAQTNNDNISVSQDIKIFDPLKK